MTAPKFEIFDVERLPDSESSRASDAAARLEALQAAHQDSALHDHEKSALAYVATRELRIAINTAVAAQMPLLLTGEPGTGKTQVAYFIAQAIGLQKPHTLHVRSTTTSRDLLYEFDAVGYLRTAYEKGVASPREPRPANEHEASPATSVVALRPQFVHRGPLWQAIASTRPEVLLIDEIDKAPRDFPNDLLHVLDQFWFDVPEFDDLREADLQKFEQDLKTNALTKTGSRWQVKSPNNVRKPIVVITSNSERQLPAAFLRRCVFHEIVVDDDLIERAMNAHRAAEFEALNPEAEARARAAFVALRDVRGLQKRPSLAEYLAWLRLLALSPVATAEILTVQPLAKLPLLGVLIKDRRDWSAVLASSDRF